MGLTSGGSANVALGSYPEYIEMAKQMGYTYFDMPPKIWDMLSEHPDIAWSINQTFLETMVNQGNAFTYYSGVQANPFNGVTEVKEIGLYGLMELEYLSGVGQNVWHSIVEQIR